jgi:hypothetical protein
MASNNAHESSLRVISDPEELARYGVCTVPIPPTLDAKKWATELSQVSPAIMAFEGDGEYAFYRNILEEPNFPFNAILDEESAVGKSLLRYFAVKNLDDIHLDDAFCVHYNMDQEDTTGARHMDPSDITVNMCLEKTKDAEGSQVLFYGTKALHTIDVEHEEKDETFRFLVSQEEGFATIHWGNHPHETVQLQGGKRTNIVLTFCYKDTSRSDVSMRTCY